MATTFIKKKSLEIITVIVTGVLLLAFIIATIVLAVLLHKAKKDTKAQCAEAYDSHGQKVTQCCTAAQGSPSITIDPQTQAVDAKCV